MALQADEKGSLYPLQAPLVSAFTLLPAQVLMVQERNRGGRASSAAGRLEIRPREERSLRIYPRNPPLRHSQLCFSAELNFLLSSYYTRPQTAPHPVDLHSPNSRSSICLHPFHQLPLPFQLSSATEAVVGLFSPRGVGVVVRWGDLREELAMAKVGGKDQKPRGCPPCKADGRFLLPLCWLGRMEETEAHRKSGRGDKLNHRVEQKPSQEETGSKSDGGG